ncbi:MAG: Protein-glutamate methylesterase [Betaproteobacteria bacterium]|nr:Protein-glutamate methylesterase [Betaproteobacteria bacterium]
MLILCVLHPQPLWLSWKTPTTDLFVIGASTGGVEALFFLSSRLPKDFPAPILVVQHIGAHRSHLPELIRRRGPNNAVEAKDGECPLPGTIYIAPSDQHMMMDGDVIRLTRGPKEHHTRPAIDPLFRSAAISLGPRAVGIILTGMLDDGASGLRAIKNCGGLTIVQEPTDAVAPSMPMSALRVVDADHVTTLENIPALMCSLAARTIAGAKAEAPEWLTLEQMSSFGDPQMKTLSEIATPSPFTCLDCGGTLFELKDKTPLRFRCHTGHGYSLRSLASTQEEMAEKTLWASIRALQEREALLRRAAQVEHDLSSHENGAMLREADRLADTVVELRKTAEKPPAA